MSEVIFDGRWEGMHGIGRFATEVEKGLGLANANFHGNPASPLDCVYLSLKLVMRRHGIFFSPGYNYPLIYGGKGLLVVHDLIHLDVPAPRWLLKKLYCLSVLRSACRRANAVLTVSEFSARRIAEVTGISRNKIIVVGNGVSNVFAKDGPRFRLQNDEVYFLATSNGKEHKNNRAVIRGFLNARLGYHVKLLFVGAPSEEIAAYVSRLGAQESIWFLGKVSEAELASLYRGALALIFPSLYEGFGLPIVESMACGTPVVTSNCTAMPEIAGGAAILVDPVSVEEIS
ncbi:glycosyltransferase family 4 protein, partial [Burkholderia sp. 8Y]|uniref:glycosyltransferase family 4 protein n=1 Tax=Burkholderia sp. 8Y TaxID=2653133 RepID=UPI00135A9647